MKKLLLIVALVAAVFCADTASACSYGRCGSYYGRSSYGRSYYRGNGRHFGYGRGYRSYGRGYRYGRGYGRRFGYGRGYGRGYRW